MSRDDRNREWVELAPAWIKEVREGECASRKGLLDKYVLDACCDVTGLKVLDCGCGEGRFGRMLAARGAGFALERIVEPTATPKSVSQYPDLDDELCVPNFIIYRLTK